ncbi:hypothetical protein AAMO2058_000664300 [Amorphochlora amoebiformis]
MAIHWLLLGATALVAQADFCKNASTVCEAGCDMIASSRILPEISPSLCRAGCYSPMIQGLDDGCISGLCEWFRGLNESLLHNPTKEAVGLEAYFTSSRALAGFTLGMTDLLKLAFGTNTNSWTSLQMKNLQAYGSYDGCKMLDGTEYCLTRLLVPDVQVGYGPFATCVPRSCSADDITKVFYLYEILIFPQLLKLSEQALYGEKLDILHGMLHDGPPRISFEGPKKSANFEGFRARVKKLSDGNITLPAVPYTTCGEKTYPVDADAITMIVVLCLLLGVVVGATFIFYYFRSRVGRSEKKDGYEHVEGMKIEETKVSTPPGGAKRKIYESLENEPNAKKPIDTTPKEDKSSMNSQESLVWEIMGALSLTKSWKSFLTIRTGTGTEAMDGVRVISMCWVVFGHTFLWPYYSSPGWSNLSDVIPFVKSNAVTATWSGQVIQSAEFSVDTFFFMSGFLAAFISLKKLRGKGALSAAKSAPLLYLNRWLRITPVYMLILWFYTLVLPVMTKGPNDQFYGLQTRDCKKYWWYNFLYIQTVFPRGVNGEDVEMCYGVSWYLADDMMFFWATPPLLVIFLLNKYIGLLFPFLLSCGSIAAAWVLAWKKQLRFSTFDQSLYTPFYYNPPWTRAPAYLFGVIFGMGYFIFKEKKMNIPRRLQGPVQIALASFAAVIFATTVYGPKKGTETVPSGFSYAENNAYVALSKPAWVMGVGAMLFLCFENLGGPVQWFLSLPIFGYMSKLTFGMYLLHPCTLALLFFNRVLPLRYTAVNFSVCFIAVLFGTMVMAFFVFLFIESPLASLQGILMKRLMPKRSRKKQSKALSHQSPINTEDKYANISTKPLLGGKGLEYKEEK